MSRIDRIHRIAIHDWGDHPCRPTELRECLDDSECEFVVRSVDHLTDCDGVVTLFHHDEFLEEVVWVHNIRSGYDDFPLDAYRESDITLTNSTGISGDLVAESVVSLMLMLSKGFHRYRDRQREATWDRLPVERPFELGESSVCVVGLGEVGGSVVSRAGILGIDTVGVDIRPVSGLGLDHVYDVTRLADAVRESRFLVLTTPLTESTRGLVDRDVFASMRDDAYLVNVSRGEVVDQAALVDALNNGDIAGAALDVFQDEPLQADSPLWDEDEVIITPHAAAQSDNFDEKLAAVVDTNVTRLNDGRQPWNEIV